MPQPAKPKLVNRGPAGLLTKLPATQKPTAGADEQPAGPINKIVESLQPLVVPIDSLTPDPQNARLHPERNMEAIKKSLSLYGQVKPVVVRRETGVVVAGNGTMEAAKALGWTEIAATFVDFNEAQAAGYGLADNRTAELAKWDFEVVARLDQLIRESGDSDMVGWSADELEVLRCADWTPPAISEGGFGEGGGDKPLLVSVTPDEMDALVKAIDQLKAAEENYQDLSDGACIARICALYIQES